MSDYFACLGCGSPANPDNPQPQRCGSCPPVKCPDCGQMDVMGAPCECWVSVSDVSLADLKGVFASGGLGVTPAPDGEPTQ